MLNSILTWLGLAALTAGLVIGVFPLLPTAPAAGALQAAPHWSEWGWGGVAAAGVALLLWGRFRESC